MPYAHSTVSSPHQTWELRKESLVLCRWCSVLTGTETGSVAKVSRQTRSQRMHFRQYDIHPLSAFTVADNFLAQSAILDSYSLVGSKHDYLHVQLGAAATVPVQVDVDDTSASWLGTCASLPDRAVAFS